MVAAFELPNHLAILVMDVVKSWIIKSVQSHLLVKDDADGTVFHDETGLVVIEKDFHLLVDDDQFFTAGAESLSRFNQKIKQRWMAHQAIDFIDGDDARGFINQAVAADGGQYRTPAREHTRERRPPVLSLS